MKFSDEKKTKLMLDDNLETVTRRVADLELNIREKDALIDTLKN